MFNLKPLSPESIPAALEKAHLYRMLNQPEQAESICHDILAVEPDNQTALVRLLLAITDRFAEARPQPAQHARDLLPRLHSLYEREYYAGIICERLALARLRSGLPQAGELAFDFFHEAMSHYERAMQLRPPANDDSLLRWNSCARIIMAYPDVRPATAEQPGGVTGD